MWKYARESGGGGWGSIMHPLSWGGGGGAQMEKIPTFFSFPTISIGQKQAFSLNIKKNRNCVNWCIDKD